MRGAHSTRPQRVFLAFVPICNGMYRTRTSSVANIRRSDPPDASLAGDRKRRDNSLINKGQVTGGGHGQEATPWSAVANTWRNAGNGRWWCNRTFPVTAPTDGNVPSAPRPSARRRRGTNGSDFGIFGKGKRVFHIDAEVAHRVLELAMTEKDLDCTQVTSCSVNDRCLRSA